DREGTVGIQRATGIEEVLGIGRCPAAGRLDQQFVVYTHRQQQFRVTRRTVKQGNVVLNIPEGNEEQVAEGSEGEGVLLVGQKKVHAISLGYQAPAAFLRQQAFGCKLYIHGDRFEGVSKVVSQVGRQLRIEAHPDSVY